MGHLQIYSISVIFLFAINFIGSNGQEEGFNNFLKNAIKDYPSWVISKGLEPSPVIPFPIDLSINSHDPNLIGELRNQVLTNHTEFGGQMVESSLAGRNFSIRIWNYHFMSVGDYNLEGTYMFDNVTGSGKVIVKTAGQSSYLTGTLAFSDFNITSDGYIDLSAGEMTQNIGASLLKATFEGLDAGGYEESVTYRMMMIYENRTIINQWLPIGRYINQYLQEVFADTPVSEIIGTTLTAHNAKKIKMTKL